MKNFILTLITIVLFACGGNAKQINGTVTDAITARALPAVNVAVKNSRTSTKTDENGKYQIEVPASNSILVFKLNKYEELEVLVGNRSVIDVSLKTILKPLDEVTVVELKKHLIEEESTVSPKAEGADKRKRISYSPILYNEGIQTQHDAIPHNTEEYDVIRENGFRNPLNEPLSTFSIDVDAASYTNVRRMINSGMNPHKDAVRIEEMINYFDYDYPDPKGEHPFSITTEMSVAPWNEKHRLVHIGLQGKMIEYEDLDPSNLVFLIDVSGSMSANNKLPLLISSMKLLVKNLKPNDRVAIVVYAGAAGLVLPSTPSSETDKIIDAMSRLSAGGSTAGGAGIQLAYEVAQENFIKNGNNRVILATDGDFNIGPSSTAAMVRLIEEKRDLGIFLTITGFGMGNYKDGRMEQISNAGNGNYFYIDNIGEAQKVFVREMRATLFTIAKDVKIQVEFNPAKVQAYRLIGYENRMLNNEDFNDDKKDAGELGAGHTVTALYEIIPVGVKSDFTKDIDPLKYQTAENPKAVESNEILTVKFRYKKPKEFTSNLIVQTLADKQHDLSHSSENFRFSAAVAEFGMLLRNSEFKSNARYDDVLKLAISSRGKDENGYRNEFIRMVESSKLLAMK